MNVHPDFRAYFTDIAKRLLLLGREPGQINLVFTEGPQGGNVLLNNVRSKLTYPILLVEFEDIDSENGEAHFQTLYSAFAVMDMAKTKNEGAIDIEHAIYQRCQRAADQIFAKMKQQSDRHQLKIGGKVAQLLGASAGNWVGPLANDLYGWRIEFSWRIAAGSCVDPTAWDLEA